MLLKYLISKKVLKAIQDFNSVSLLLIFHDLVSVVVLLCIYGCEKNLRGLVKKGTGKHFSYLMKLYRTDFNNLAIYPVV